MRILKSCTTTTGSVVCAENQLSDDCDLTSLSTN